MCKSYHSQMLLKTLTPVARGGGGELISQGRYFHNAFLNQKTLWKEVTATVTESLHFLKVQHERFYPCPHSCQHRALGSTWSSNPPASPVCSTDYSSTGWERPCPLGAVPGAAGQGSQTWCSDQSQTDAVSWRQFLLNGAHQTDQSVSGENGLLSSQINLLPHTAVFKPTHTEIQGILQWFGLWAHIPALLLPLMMRSPPGESFAVLHLMVYLSSMIRIPPPSTTHSRGSSTSALCWPPVLPENTTSALPGGATQDNTEKNLKTLGNEGFAYQMP